MDGQPALRTMPVKFGFPVGSRDHRPGELKLDERIDDISTAMHPRFNPGATVNFPLGALAYLGLARARAEAGDTSRAKVAYKDFLTFWQDADPDIPILKEAKAEYAKLQ